MGKLIATFELLRMWAEELPLYIVGNMHDGMMILQDKSLDLAALEERINKVLGKYSMDCIGLALKVTMKGEPEE